MLGNNLQTGNLQDDQRRLGVGKQVNVRYENTMFLFSISHIPTKNQQPAGLPLTRRLPHLPYTVEPPNKGHIGTRSFVLQKRCFSFIQRLKCTGIIRTSRFVLYRELSFIRSVLYWIFHCNHQLHFCEGIT